jgi:hypothetical protein
MEANKYLQNSRILKIYNIYRVILFLILLLSFFSSLATIRPSNHNPEIFVYVTAIYFVFSIIIGFDFIPRKRVLPRLH